jgi:hypothetical protein
MLDRDEKGQVQLIRYFGHYSLLDAIYQHLTDAILGNHIRVCEHCRQPFIAKNNKAKFCRPKRGYGEVSQCLSRAKQANYRRRKKKG